MKHYSAIIISYEIQYTYAGVHPSPSLASHAHNIQRQ